MTLLAVGACLWSLWRDVPYSADVFDFAVPNAAFLREQVLRGKLPLWNPYVLGGHPFLAEIQTQVLYPLSLVWLLLNPLRSMGGFLWMHLVLGAWGAFEWARTSRLRPQACAVAGVAFGLSPLLVEHFQHPNLLCSLVWAPWVWWAALRLAQRPSMRRTAVLGAVWALSLLGGAPEFSLFAGLGAAWVLRRRPLWGVLGAGLGTLASAAEMVPFVELVRLSERAAGESLAEICRRQLFPSELVDLFAPFTEYASWQHCFYFNQLFLGMSPGILSLVATRRLRWPLLALLGGLLLLALGNHTPVYPLLWEWLPLVRMLRFPIKYTGMMAAVLSLAAAYGVHRGFRRSGRAAALLAGGLLALGGLLGAAGQISDESPWLGSLAWLLLVAGGLLAASRLARRQARAWATAGVVLAELGAFQLTVTQHIFAMAPPCTDEPLLHEPGRVLFDLGPDNVASNENQTALCELGLANRNQLSHQFEVNGFVVPGPGTIRRLMRQNVPGAYALFRPSTLVVSEQTDRRPYPEGVEIMKRGRFTALRVGPPVRALWLEAGAEVALLPSAEDIDSLEFALPGRAGTLRVLDTYFPGWVARVDGLESPITDAMGVREVQIPAGAKRLSMHYEPGSFRLGGGLSVLGLLALLVLAAEPGPLRRRVQSELTRINLVRLT